MNSNPAPVVTVSERLLVEIEDAVSALHGHNSRAEPRSPTYRVWERMRERCRSTSRHNSDRYAKRGIRACERWSDFAAFLADMGERPAGTSLDRIDNDGHYSPENCRWATPQEQARNRSTAHLIDFNGQSKALIEWCETLGLPYNLTLLRLRRGWPVEKALTAAKRKPQAEWSADEIAVLMQHFGTGNWNKTVGRNLPGRSAVSIRIKAYKLGLRIGGAR